MGILTDRPVLRRIVAKIAAEIATRNGTPVGPAVTETVVERVAEKLASDPVLKNELNEEKPLESGVTVAFGQGIAVAIAAIAYQWLSGNWSEEITVAAIAMALTQLWGLYRRWAPGLGPLTWFGLRRQ